MDFLSSTIERDCGVNRIAHSFIILACPFQCDSDKRVTQDDLTTHFIGCPDYRLILSSSVIASLIVSFASTIMIDISVEITMIVRFIFSDYHDSLIYIVDILTGPLNIKYSKS